MIRILRLWFIHCDDLARFKKAAGFEGHRFTVSQRVKLFKIWMAYR